MNNGSLVFEGWLKPLIFRTNCSEAARISSSVAGGSKLNRGRMFLHTLKSLRLSNRDKNEQFYNIPYNGVNRLTRIVADDLQNDEVSSLVDYMTAMSGGQITWHKKILEVTGPTNTKIRFLLRKFLYSRHLTGYEVLETAGNFEIVHLKPEKKQGEQHETLSPTMDVRSVGLGSIPRWVQPSDMIEWEGQPPPEMRRKKK